jgi:mannose-6-phosphate isomerase-like protein (cupin superfamily)
VKHVNEHEVEGIRAPAPHARTLKHLAAPWTIGSTKIWLGISKVDPGSTSNSHLHEVQEEIFYVLSGRGRIAVGDESVEVTPGSVVVVPAGMLHQLINTGDETLEVLAAVAPPFDEQEFEVRHELDTDDAT